MRHKLSQISAVRVSAAYLYQEVGEKNSNDGVPNYCEVVLSTVLEVARVERRLHEGRFLREIAGKNDIGHKKGEGSLSKRELRLIGKTEVLGSNKQTSNRHGICTGVNTERIAGEEDN